MSSGAWFARTEITEICVDIWWILPVLEQFGQRIENEGQ
jgi:hypothetical protein